MEEKPAEELAIEYYKLHEEYVSFMDELEIVNIRQVAKLAILHEAMVKKGIHLARAILNEKSEKKNGTLAHKG